MDLISRQAEINERKYTFGNNEFNLEAAYHDCKLVFDGITDDDSFQEADTGLILYYANEILYALQEALEDTTKDTTYDCISRQAAIDALAEHEKSNGHNYTLFVDIVSECAEIIRDLPSAQPEPAVWLMDGTVHGEIMHRCSECGEQEHVPLVMGLPSWKYCPNCGRKMEVDG